MTHRTLTNDCVRAALLLLAATSCGGEEAGPGDRLEGHWEEVGTVDEEATLGLSFSAGGQAKQRLYWQEKSTWHVRLLDLNYEATMEAIRFTSSQQACRSEADPRILPLGAWLPFTKGSAGLRISVGQRTAVFLEGSELPEATAGAEIGCVNGSLLQSVP